MFSNVNLHYTCILTIRRRLSSRQFIAPGFCKRITTWCPAFLGTHKIGRHQMVSEDLLDHDVTLPGVSPSMKTLDSASKPPCFWACTIFLLYRIQSLIQFDTWEESSVRLFKPETVFLDEVFYAPTGTATLSHTISTLYSIPCYITRHNCLWLDVGWKLTCFCHITQGES